MLGRLVTHGYLLGRLVKNGYTWTRMGVEATMDLRWTLHVDVKCGREMGLTGGPYMWTLNGP